MNPIIATVLIIGFTIALAGIIINFTGGKYLNEPNDNSLFPLALFVLFFIVVIAYLAKYYQKNKQKPKTE